MAGLSPHHYPTNVSNIIADNIRLTEIKSNRKERMKYGVDHLFSED